MNNAPSRRTSGRKATLLGFKRSVRGEIGKQLADEAPHRLGGMHICGLGTNRDLQGLSSTTGSVCGRPGSIHPPSIYLQPIDLLARPLIDPSVHPAVHPAGRAGARSNISKNAAGESNGTGYSCADLTLLAGCPPDTTRGVCLAYHSSSVAGPRISAPESRARPRPPRQVAANSQGLSSTPLLCCCSPSQLAPPPFPPHPKSDLALSLSPCAGSLSQACQGCLQDPVSDKPPGAFPDTPKRPPARPYFRPPVCLSIALSPPHLLS